MRNILSHIAIAAASGLLASFLVGHTKQSEIRALKDEIATLRKPARQTSVAGSQLAPQPTAKAVAQPAPSYPTGDFSAPEPAQLVKTPLPPAHASSAAEAEAKAERKVGVLYGAFLDHLAASGRDASAFKKLLLQRELLVSDIIAAARAQGIDPLNKEAWKPVNELISKAVREHNSHMKDTLGAAAYEEYLSWEIKKPEFNIAKEINRRLDPQHALTPAQQDEFVGVLQNLRDSTGTRRTVSIPDPDTNILVQVRVLPQAALERLRQTLTPQQMEKLREIYAEQDRLPAGIVHR